MPLPQGYEPLPHSERPPSPGWVEIGAVEKSEKVGFTILLRAHPGAPDEPGLDDASGRTFLSAEEWMRTYGASEDDLRTVLAFLHEKGLRVIDSSAGRRRVVAEGEAGKVDAAFAITLNRYRAAPSKASRSQADEIYRAYQGPVHLPAALIGIVEAVIGLNTRQLLHPMGTGTGDPPNSNYLSPVAIAQLYNFPNTGAAGQTVGVFENAAAGAAYLHTDIADFVASMPPGYQTQPASLNDIGLTVGATTYFNNGALVSASPIPGVLECTEDVSIVAAVAQGANINVYFTDGTEAGWDAFFDRAIFPLPGDNPPSVLTASWGFVLQDDPATIGNPHTPGTPAHNLTRHIRRAAHRGITIFMAIGDWGSADLVVDGKCHIAYPNGDPGVTACGGTIVGNITATGFQEFVWSEANTTSPFQNFPYESTGGGVSDNFHRPFYQIEAGVAPVSNNDGNIRHGVPDVAGMVAQSGFFFAGNGGPGQYGSFGTSLVAPLYASLIATINAYLGRNTGFLNPHLYRHGPSICRDVRFGNNDAGNGPIPPDAPVYVAGPGWDACTGWGSIDGIRLRAALAPAPMLVTAIPDAGDFGNVCQGGFRDEILTINNAGFSVLLVSDITSSSPDFVLPTVVSYPLAVAPGDSIDVVIRFQPTALGAVAATLTIYSNDLLGPRTIDVSGFAPAPRLVLSIADNGNFGRACVGSFVGETLVLGNSGSCPLQVQAVTSSNPAFELPEVITYPISIAPGGFFPLSLRYAPSGLGAAVATITVISNDPSSPATIMLSGHAPPGKIAVTGSTFFGNVPACCAEEKTIAICNVGECRLHVSSVAFRRKSRHWRLLGNPFPATLAPGSCLSVVIRYKANEQFPRPCELVIHSDDPVTPVVRKDVLAATIWPEHGCSRCCEECRKGACDKCHCAPKECRRCCDDELDEEPEEEDAEA